MDLSTSGCANQEHFVVEHISLLFTVFRHVQGAGVGRLCQIPNIVLNSLWVENVSRSKAMTEQLEIDIAFGTPFDDLQILKNELLTFVTDSENSRDYQPTVDLDVLGTSDQSKLTLMVEIKHKSNWANETIRRSRRSRFMCALTAALKAVPVYPPGGGADVAGSAANPNYSVAISHSEAKEHADESALDREKSRLVPLKKLELKKSTSPVTTRSNKAFGGMTQHQTQVVEDLTNRDPAFDAARDDAWNSSRDDNSTLGERPSIDRQDQEDIKGLLRRESTKGKRKPSSEGYHPSIPTINEPQQSTYPDYPAQYAASSNLENQAPGPAYSTMPAAYQSAARPTPSQYGVTPGQAQTTGQAIEMSQAPSQRSSSNPYRSESLNRKPLSPPGAAEGEDEWNMRPYSGV